MADRLETRDHNLALLHELDFKKNGNTTVFHKGEHSLLSPAVAENLSGGYWFDVRQANLNRLGENAYLLVRIVPDHFIFEPLERISTLLTSDLMEYRRNSGNVWGLGIELAHSNMSAHLFHKSKSIRKVRCQLLTLEEARQALTLLN